MSDTDVVVVGGINADVTGRSAEELVPGTSNPGTISITPGGAGRNIAEALARLGTRCRLVGTIGDDEFGRVVLARSVEAGVDVTGVATIDGNTGVYLTVVDEDGTMHVSISDMPGAARTDAAFVSAALEGITAASVVIVDTNVPTDAITATLEWAAARGALSIVQVVSVPKVRRLVGVDARADWIIMNVDEYVAFAAACKDRSVVHAENALVTRGAQGVDRVSLSTGESVTYPSSPARVIDENGAGDAFTAGFCAGITAGDDIEAAVRMGAATAALTVESVGTVPSDLTLTAVHRLLRGRGS